MALKRNKTAGFTLTEVLIALVIVSILAAIALPSYRNYILRNNRAMVKRTLTELMTKQEAQFLRTRSYAATFQPLVGGAAGTTQIWLDNTGKIEAAETAASRYRVAFDTSAPAGTVRFIAEPRNSQTRDTACPSFALSSTGTRAPATGDCWDR